MMPTLTIELPEETYQNALALPLSERQRRIVDAFATARNGAAQPSVTSPTFVDHRPGEPFPDLPGLPAAHVAAIAEGMTDTGERRDSKTVIAEMRERLANGQPLPTREKTHI